MRDRRQILTRDPHSTMARWRYFVDAHESYLWKPRCIQRGWLSPPRGLDRQHEVYGEHKRAFIEKYSVELSWRRGAYRNISKAEEADSFMMRISKFDAKTWGEIFEAECLH